MTEQTRYIGSDGKPINLAQTSGHARLDLKRIQKFKEPQSFEEAMDIMLDDSAPV